MQLIRRKDEDCNDRLYFDLLPVDVFFQFSKYLIWKDFCALASTCKSLEQLITKNDSIWATLASNSWIEKLQVKTRSSFRKIILGTQGSPKELNLKLVSCSAEDWSNYYGIQNLFKRDTSVFCTKRGYCANVNVVCSIEDFPEGSICFVKELELTAPLGGFTRPVKDAIVFLSQELVPVEDKTDTDNMTNLQFDSEHRFPSERKVKYLPDAYLTCSRKGLVRHEFAEAVPTKFIHLKLLTAYGTDDNIDVCFFGARGYFINI